MVGFIFQSYQVWVDKPCPEIDLSDRLTQMLVSLISGREFVLIKGPRMNADKHGHKTVLTGNVRLVLRASRILSKVTMEGF